MKFEKGQQLWINIKGKAMFVEIAEIAGTTIHFKDPFEEHVKQSNSLAPLVSNKGDCKNCGEHAQLTPTGLSGFNLCNRCYQKYLHGV